MNNTELEYLLHTSNKIRGFKDKIHSRENSKDVFGQEKNFSPKVWDENEHDYITSIGLGLRNAFSGTYFGIEA